MRHKQAEYDEARRLRATGWSLRRIASQLGVALSSVSVWVRDVPKPASTSRRPAHQRRRPPPTKTPLPVPAGTRHCPRCATTLALTAFNRNGDDFQWWCRECFRKYFKQRGQLHRDQCAAGKRRRAQIALAYIDDYLRAHACVDCGEEDADILEFDHVGTKRGDVGVMASDGWSVEALRREIAECEVACANCHRRRTAIRQRSWRTDPATALELPLLMPHERRNVRFVRETLMRSQCADCGLDDLMVLEFDHVGEKTGNIGFLARSGCSFARLKAEIARCEIRCANCHPRRTRRQLGHRTRGPKLPEPP